MRWLVLRIAAGWACGGFVLALVNGAIAAERPPARAPGPQTLATLGYVCVPLQRTAEGHLYARARINGRRCVALVDTGWSFTTLAAQKANRVFKIAARGAQADALIERLDLAKHSFPNQPARVEPLLFDGQPASFDCVLGLDFLRRHYALLDCARGRLYLRFGAPTAPEARRLETLLHECGFDAVPLSFDTPPALTVRAHINARPVDMLVDSAAVWSVLDPRELERLGLRAEPTLARLTGAGSTGTRPVLVAEAPSLTLESARLRSPRFAVMALADWGMASPHAPLPHVGGILGSPELRALEALVDCHGLKLHLRPRQSKR